MEAKDGGFGAGKKRWPTALDKSDPEGMADFLLGLGYGIDNVAQALADHCRVNFITAKRIVTDVANLTGGHA
jgi:hypothetical protein